MGLNNIIGMLSDSNIAPGDIFALVDEVKNMDLSNEQNIRNVIRKISVISGKRIDRNMENELVRKIMTDGIPQNLFDMF